MWLGLRNLLLAALLVLAASCDVGARGVFAMAEPRPYRPEICAYCEAPTWCVIRANGKPQCRGCQVIRFFEEVLYPPLGYKLQAWQRKDLRAVYGAVQAEDGLRQYRKTYQSTAKQNGKSFLLGGAPIYHLIVEADYTPQPEAYGVASAKDQAGIVYKAAALLVQKNSLLRDRLKILESTKRIIRRDGNGIYQVLSADGDVQDGKRPSLLMFDELHRFTKKKAETVRTVLIKGMISRAPIVDGVQTGEPLMLQTTTSGDEQECPLWASEYEYAKMVRDGVRDDPSYYASIYQADPIRIQNDKEYWKTREARVAANPSHQDNGGFLPDKAIEAEMLEAIARPEKYADYIRLNLNVPAISTDTPVVNMHLWYANGGDDDLRKWPEYDVDLLVMKWGLKRRSCYLGVDLAWTTDMTGMSLVFPPEQENERWKLVFFAWLPEDRVPEIERITRAPLKDWVKRGFIQTVPGMKMRVLTVEDKIRWAAKTFSLQEVCYDPYGQLRRSMEVLAEKDELTCVEIEQKIPVLTQPTKEFIEMYMAGEFQHGNNPVANWHVSCLSLDRDHNDNVKPRKPERDNSKKRIDLVAATINAMKRAVPAEDSSEARVIFI